MQKTLTALLTMHMTETDCANTRRSRPTMQTSQRHGMEAGNEIISCVAHSHTRIYCPVDCFHAAWTMFSCLPV